jgi:MSHA biogenesis protein MshP
MSCPTRQPRACAAGQTGFSLIAAIFLIVVLAALGAFAVQVAMSQYQGATSELLQARAQAAAEAGMEYGANITLQRAVPSCLTYTLNLTQGALAGFVVKVACTSTTPHQIYSAATSTFTSYTVYALAATASKGTYGAEDYVARTVTRNVTNAPP